MNPDMKRCMTSGDIQFHGADALDCIHDSSSDAASEDIWPRATLASTSLLAAAKSSAQADKTRAYWAPNSSACSEGRKKLGGCVTVAILPVSRNASGDVAKALTSERVFGYCSGTLERMY